jgi:hypothetical protein
MIYAAVITRRCVRTGVLREPIGLYLGRDLPDFVREIVLETVLQARDKEWPDKNAMLHLDKIILQAACLDE